MSATKKPEEAPILVLSLVLYADGAIGYSRLNKLNAEVSPLIKILTLGLLAAVTDAYADEIKEL